MTEIPRFYVVKGVEYLDDVMPVLLDTQTGHGYPFMTVRAARLAAANCNAADAPLNLSGGPEVGDAALDKLAKVAGADPLAMDPDEREATRPARFAAVEVLRRRIQRLRRARP